MEQWLENEQREKEQYKRIVLDGRGSEVLDSDPIESEFKPIRPRYLPIAKRRRNATRASLEVGKIAKQDQLTPEEIDFVNKIEEIEKEIDVYKKETH